MIIWLRLDDVLVFEGEADAAPPAGSIVEFRMAETVGAIPKGSLASAKVSANHPARYDFDTIAPKLIVESIICEPHLCLD
ncbi:hypothetical protein GCM10008023_38920 [Sphingomonas glacialis]|uniref:Uncharacterized protein n=1 Tax=Sphingomonas glacialis TaxID=658225 RepID=A0ABQ3LT47_9SPHN|nr:hypothetical protein [Sphingomonas glacialis]GHH25468.1 hypothetical protein GCM10008023_38920 [Sphingomonas glacialis]